MLNQNPVMNLYPFDNIIDLVNVRFELDNVGSTNGLEEPMQVIEQVVSEALTTLGHPRDMSPLRLLPSERDVFISKVKKEDRWRSSATEIIRLNSEPGQDMDIERMLTAITRPWFNEVLVYYGGQMTTPDGLRILGSGRHSYFTHFTDQLMPTGQNSMPLSVAGVIRLDDMVIMGWRGGQNYNETIMAIPAGSVVLGKDLRHAFGKEMGEEVGSLPKEAYVSEPRAVAMVHDPRGKGWQYIVVDVHLSMKTSDFMRHWLHAEREHRSLVLLPDDLESVLHYFGENMYDVSRENQDRRSATTPDNIGKVLPQAAAIVLSSYAARDLQHYLMQIDGFQYASNNNIRLFPK